MFRCELVELARSFVRNHVTDSGGNTDLVDMLIGKGVRSELDDPKVIFAPNIGYLSEFPDAPLIVVSEFLCDFNRILFIGDLFSHNRSYAFVLKTSPPEKPRFSLCSTLAVFLIAV